jgi:hypothetical protein
MLLFFNNQIQAFDRSLSLRAFDARKVWKARRIEAAWQS